MKLNSYIRRRLGRLLTLSRQNRNLHQAYVAKSINISVHELDSIEIGCKSANWRKYQKLLDFYKQTVEITLVDKPKT